MGTKDEIIKVSEVLTEEDLERIYCEHSMELYAILCSQMDYAVVFRARQLGMEFEDIVTMKKREYWKLCGRREFQSELHELLLEKEILSCPRKDWMPWE